MGKGIDIKSDVTVTPAPHGAGVPSLFQNGEDIPKLEGQSLSKLEELNQLLLQGKSPSSATAAISSKLRQSTLENQLMKNKSIVERNIEAFKRVGMKKDAVYASLLDIMNNAYKTGPTTKTDAEGKRYVKYDKMPDYTARLNAAKQMSLLMGLDPRAEMKVTMATDGKGNTVVSVELKDQYISIAHMPNEEAIQAYNEMKRNETQGNYRIISNEPVLEGEFTNR